MYREFTKNTITFFWDEIKLRFFLRCVPETLDFIDKAKTNISEYFHFFPILPLLGTSFLLIKFQVSSFKILFTHKSLNTEYSYHMNKLTEKSFTELKMSNTFFFTTIYKDHLPSDPKTYFGKC